MHRPSTASLHRPSTVPLLGFWATSPNSAPLPGTTVTEAQGCRGTAPAPPPYPAAAPPHSRGRKLPGSRAAEYRATGIRLHPTDAPAAATAIADPRNPTSAIAGRRTPTSAIAGRRTPTSTHCPPTNPHLGASPTSGTPPPHVHPPKEPHPADGHTPNVSGRPPRRNGNASTTTARDRGGTR